VALKMFVVCLPKDVRQGTDSLGRGFAVANGLCFVVKGTTANDKRQPTNGLEKLNHLIIECAREEYQN